MAKKPANRKHGESMNPAERIVEPEARKESWITKMRRTLKGSKAKPGPAKKPDPAKKSDAPPST